MSKRIPIKAARDFAKANGLRYVVIFARGPGSVSHVVTYGNTVEESAAAAKLGNHMKRGLGWPEKLQATPARVARLRRAAEQMDWQQVVLNGGPPCFHVCRDGNFCGRAQRWEGHNSIHKFVALADLLPKA